jgi:hypothetical protein
MTLVKATGPLLNLLLRFRQKATSNWRVSVESNTELAKQREKECILLTRNRRVVALVDSWEDIAVLLAVVIDFLDSVGLEIRQTKAREHASLVDFLYTRNPIVERDTGIWCVDVEYINFLSGTVSNANVG